MSTPASRPRGCHLVGSVPLASAEEVLRRSATVLGPRLRRLPDGETGERSNWFAWQERVFAEHPALALDPHDGPERHRLRDRDAAGASFAFDAIGYADAALASWEAFEQLAHEGVIAPGQRFQVSLPTPLAPVAWFASRADVDLIEPAYEAAMAREVRRIAAAIPRERLAIQWDVAIEIAMLEGRTGSYAPWFDDVEAAVLERLVRLAGQVPTGVELGFHFCYGDNEHRHFVQPRDASLPVRLANHVTAHAPRAIDWIHLPIPRERDDAAYVEPLRELRLAPRTEVALGLVHLTDGVDGTLRRIAVAERVLPAFTVATECGFGRRPPETVERLLAIHRDVTEPRGETA